MKSISILTGLVIGFSQPSFGRIGGSSDGGGNAICNSRTNRCKMVEEFVERDLSRIKGHRLYQAKIDSLREVFPEFVKNLEKAVQRKTWYLIPADFDVLSVDQTQLRFDTNQAAYQNDGEVFISANSLDRMEESSAAIKLMHESLMAMQNTRNASGVRQVTAEIFARAPEASRVQGALARHQLGIYFQSHQLVKLRQKVLNSYLTDLAVILGRARAQCGFDTPDEIKRDILRLYQGDKVRLAKDSLKRVSNELNSWPDRYPMLFWNSPFSSSPSYGGGMRFLFPAGRSTALEIYPSWIVREHQQEYAEDFAENVNQASVGQSGSLNSVTFDRIISALIKPVEEEAFKVREDLARNPAFIDLLAIQVKYGQSENELRPDYFDTPDHQRLAPIFARVSARLSSVRLLEPAKTLERLCHNVQVIQYDVERAKARLGN